MLPTSRFVKNAVRALLFVCIYIQWGPVFAQTPAPPAGPVSAETMLVNLAQQMPNLMRLVTSIAYVLGMYFIFHGMIKLKHFGESRTMMSQEHSLMGPIVFLTVGAMLLYFPTTVQVGLSTFWTNPSPYSYVSQQDQWSQFLNNCYLVIQLVGAIAFIRGLVIMSHLGSRGQPGTFSKGLAHIIGGIFCINIYQTVQVILVTLGVSTWPG